jgi:hypothetical protein
LANNAIQVKRTNVSGRQPNTTGSYSTNSQYISAGELALNMADGILYTSNGSAVIPIGSNNINVNVTGNLTVNNIVANNSNGAPGTVLTSNGSSVYWGTSTTSGLSVYSINGEGGSLNSTVSNVTGIQFDYNTGFHVTDEGSGNVFVSLGSGFKTIQVAGQTSITAVGEDTLVIANGAGITLSTSNSAPKTLTISSTGTVTEIDSGNGLSGGPITTSGTLSVLANTGIVANSSGTFVDPNYVGTQTANNTNFVGSISAANVVSNAQLQANLSNYITNSTAYSTFATNSYVNSTFATNTYVNATFATNSYVNSTFATNTYVNSTFAPLAGATFTGVVNHNANVIIDVYGTSTLIVGNSTINTVVNSSSITVSNSVTSITMNTTSYYVGNSTANVSINSNGVTISANGLGYVRMGNSTINTVVNATAVYIANSTGNTYLNAGLLTLTNTISIGNSTVNTQANSSLLVANNIFLRPQSGVAANTSEGSIFYDSINHAFNVYSDDPSTPQEIGQQQFVRVVNKTGSILNFGQAVYINGAQGNRPTVNLAIANSSSTYDVLGLVSSSSGIANNAEGFVITSGLVQGYDTSSFSAGSVLYLSPTTPGGLTNVAPTYPSYNIVVGQALNSTNNGKIYLSIVPNYLAGIPNTAISISNGTVLTYSNNFTFDYANNVLTVGNSSIYNTIGYVNAAGSFSYLQIVGNVNNSVETSIVNSNTGNNSSADFIAYDSYGINGSNYIDFGINGNGYNQSTWTINGPSDGYFYTGNTNLSIGTNLPTGYLNFFTGGTLASNERLRITNTYINVNTGLTLNSPAFTIGSSFVANTTGVYSTGTVNASSLNVGTNFVANSSGISTSNATFSALTIANNLTVTGNLTISGNTVIVGSNNLIVQDSVISVHTQANLAPWTTDDGLNIGLALHYYDTSDKQGFLGRENSTGRLVWYDTSTDVIGGSVSGNTLGTMQANQFWVGNGSVYSTVNSTVFTGTANNANYLNNKTEANLNVNSAITSNSSNNSSYLNNKTEANLNVNNALTANSSSYLGSAAAASYVQNTDSRTLSGNLNFTGTNTYFSGKTTFNANANFNTNIFLNSGLAIIDSTGSQGTVGQVLASNGAGNIYWTSASINSNNASYLGGVAAASYVQNTDSRTLSGNLNFTGTNVTFGSTISANINGNANNSSYLGTVAAASYVQNTDSRTLSGNLNFTGTNVTFGSTISANINGNANNSSYLGTVAAASYVQNTDSRTLSGNLNFTGTNVYFTTINFGAVATGTGGNITNSSIVFLGNNTVNAYLNTIGLNVNNSTIANTTGVYTGIVNAASHTVGTNFIANTTGIYTTGTVNAASLTVGGAEVVNSTGIYTTGTVNAASLTVGGAEVVNATGLYTTGTVNAASHTVGTNFIANTTQLTLSSITLSSNGSNGTAGQVLTSNGSTGSPYWAVPSATVNTAAQFTWTNTHVFSNTTASGNATSGAVQFSGGIGIANNVYVGGRVGWSNATNISVVYTYYNSLTNSLDTVFG